MTARKRQWRALGQGQLVHIPQGRPSRVPCDITCFHGMHGSAANLESFHSPWQFDGISAAEGRRKVSRSPREELCRHRQASRGLPWIRGGEKMAERRTLRPPVLGETAAWPIVSKGVRSECVGPLKRFRRAYR